MIHGTADDVRLIRADVGPTGTRHVRRGPDHLGRRLLEQIAAGAIYANRTAWAIAAAASDTGITPASRLTANAALELLNRWRFDGLVAFAGAAGDNGLFRLELLEPGRTRLDDLRAAEPAR